MTHRDEIYKIDANEISHEKGYFCQRKTDVVSMIMTKHSCRYDFSANNDFKFMFHELRKPDQVR